MQHTSYDAEIRARNPIVCLDFSDAAGGFIDRGSGAVFNASPTGTVLFQQPSTLPGRTAASFTYDAFAYAPNNNLGDFDWGTQWWAVIRVQINVARSGFTRVPLFSKGTVDANGDYNASQGYMAYLHWVGSACLVTFNMSSSGAASGTSQGIQCFNTLDLQNGNTFTLAFSYDGSGSVAGMKVYVDGQTSLGYNTAGSPTANSMSSTSPLCVAGVFADTFAAEESIHNAAPTLVEHFALGTGALDLAMVYNLVAHGRYWQQVLGARPATPINLIWDNDGDQDTDNLNSLSIAARLHQLGYIKLLGVNNTTWNDLGGAILQQILDLAGLHHVPVSNSMGTWPSAFVNMAGDVVCTTATIDAFNQTYLTRAQRITDVTNYRTLLAAAPDHSVHIALGGAARGIYNLLLSPADAISSLTGQQLFAAKVVDIHMLGGAGGTDDYNTAEDVTGLSYVAAHCGVPFYFYALNAYVPSTGPGADVARLANDPLTQSVVRAQATIRPSWDVLPVVGIVTGMPGDYFAPGPPGTVTFTDSNGSSTFSTTTNTQHYSVLGTNSGQYLYMTIFMNSLLFMSPQARPGLSV